ncbi:MAG: hypothetical protein DLM69_00590 [Candidatus Chloroheliales bacterium]|nr:MAG: hypothetical protein DLM69_00590 [Chloroflexota bacterium]
MTLEVRVWASSIRDGWQVDRARRPSQTMRVGEQLLEQREGQWLLFYILAQQVNQRRTSDKVKVQR